MFARFVSQVLNIWPHAGCMSLPWGWDMIITPSDCGFFFLSPKVSFSSFILGIHWDTFAPLGMLKVTLGVKVCSYSPWTPCAGKCCSTWPQPGEVCVKGDGFIEQVQHLEETAMFCWTLNNSHWLDSIGQNFHNFNPFLSLLAFRWSGFSPLLHQPALVSWHWQRRKGTCSIAGHDGLS